MSRFLCALVAVSLLCFCRVEVQKEVFRHMSELKKSYESMMVISTKLGDEGIKSVVEKFKKLISDNADLKSVDDWGKRRLAYPINYENEGYYVLFNFESKVDFPAELDRIYNITDGVIRTLIISKEV